MGAWDLAVVALFLGATVVLGLRRAGGAADTADEYLVAGRTLGLGTFVVTLVATWYGGVLGVGEYSYTHGISNWIVLGLPYYVGALLFALLFARRARASADYTVPDMLYDTYGRSAGALGSVIVFAMSLPGAYVLMIGVLLRRVTGWSQWFSVVVAAAFCLAYIAARGFRGVVGTKWLQFALMYGGFAVLLPVAMFRSGGWSFLVEKLPATCFAWDGGRGGAYVAAWYFIALQTLVEPTFFQRTYAARSPRLARTGILIAIACFAVFDGLTTFTGMYARSILPALPSAVDAFPALGEALLPPPLLGLFYAGLLATIMSTVDSFLLVGGVTIGRDLAWRLSDGRADQVRWSRIGLVLATAASAGIALASDSVVSLWYGFGSIGTVTLLPPLLGALYPALRTSARVVPWGMALAGALTIAWLVLSMNAPGGSKWLGLEPIYPGLAVAFGAHGVGMVTERRARRP